MRHCNAAEKYNLKIGVMEKYGHPICKKAECCYECTAPETIKYIFPELKDYNESMKLEEVRG